MNESNNPRIVFSERLATGIMVHFETGVPVFYSSDFLYGQRKEQPDIDFGVDDEEDDGPPHGNGDHLQLSEANHKTKRAKILVVDGSERVRRSLGKVLKFNKFQITTAGDVKEALHLIHAESFDVLLCDARIPEAAEGFGLVKAMHDKNPHGVSLVYAGYSELERSLDAMMLPANEVTVKPMAIPTLVSLIYEKLAKRGKPKATKIERVAAILERDASTTIGDWLLRVEREDELTCVQLSEKERTGHLPKLLQELVHRLRVPRKLGTRAVSKAAAEHGKIRHAQGYSVPMIIEESRILQVSIFETLQNNLETVDFSLLLLDVMAIADEVDSQLKQAIISFTAAGVAA